MLMRHPFFPEPFFAWLFCAALVLITGLASYTDLRRLTIPKGLTLTALALGLLTPEQFDEWVDPQKMTEPGL